MLRKMPRDPAEGVIKRPLAEAGFLLRDAFLKPIDGFGGGGGFEEIGEEVSHGGVRGKIGRFAGRVKRLEKRRGGVKVSAS
jgi:hypothetical protein